MNSDFNWDNLYFSMAAKAKEEQQARRIKGYFVCPISSGCGSDFIKAKASVSAVCPLCGNANTIRIMHLDDAQFRLTVARWKDEGSYSDARADVLNNRKEKAS